MDEIISLLNNQNIENSIASIKECLESINHESIENLSSKTYLEEIKEAIISGRLKTETIIDLKLQGITTSKVDDNHLNTLFLLAHFYTALSELTLENGRIMLSWRSLTQANHLFGFLSGYITSTTNPHLEASSKGGTTKSNNIHNTEKTLIKMFYKSAPPKGWKSPKQATRHIIENLTRSQRESLLKSQKIENLEQYILDFIIKENLIEQQPATNR